MPFLTVGYPTLDATLALASALAAAGADMFELGMPFSDPLADGATIQQASQIALANGVTAATCLETARQIRERIATPLLLMGYYNPIQHYGLEAFCTAARDAGVDGLIVPDLPPEESAELQSVADGCSIDLIYLVAPTSTDERIAKVAAVARGFIYCVALTGVTGARSSLSANLGEFLQRVRRHTDLPLVVGFGISRPEHVAEVARFADGAIVASALIDRMNQLGPAERVAGVAAFVRELAAATHH